MTSCEGGEIVGAVVVGGWDKGGVAGRGQVMHTNGGSYRSAPSCLLSNITNEVKLDRVWPFNHKEVETVGGVAEGEGEIEREDMACLREETDGMSSGTMSMKR